MTRAYQKPSTASRGGKRKMDGAYWICTGVGRKPL